MVLVAAALLWWGPGAWAAEREGAIWEKAGGMEMVESLDKDTRRLLDGMGIDGLPQEGIEGGRVFSALSRLVKDKISGPLRACGALVGMVVLCRLAQHMETGAAQEAVGLVGGLACGLVVVPPMLGLITTCERTAQSASVFLLAGAPAYAALLTVSGGAASGGGYSFLTLGLGSAISLLSTGVLMPLLRVFLALAVSAGVSGAKVQRLTDGLYSLTKWLLVLGVTLFSGVLSVQTVINSHMDAAASKAAKLIASSAIPIVGGVLGDAVGAIQGSIEVVKSGAGAFGILAALCVFAPAVIEAALWAGVCTAGQLAADLCGAAPAGSLLGSCAAAAKMALAVLCSLCAVCVTCAGVVLFAKGG